MHRGVSAVFIYGSYNIHSFKKNRTKPKLDENILYLWQTIKHPV